MFHIDTVDFAATDAPRRFVRSLRETGFAVIRNHPVGASLIDEMYGDWKAFFASPTKHDYLFDGEKQDGLFPFRSENAKNSVVKDLKEFYHVYPDGRLPDAVAATTDRMYAELFNLGRTLLGWIQDNVEPTVAATFSEPLPKMLDGSQRCLLRVLHYPAIGETFEEGAVRAAAHEDINLITLLVAGSEPGLQAKDTAGNWHEVPCDAGMITVNCGDMLSLMTDGYFPSTTHRVVNPPPEFDVARYSMPMFLHPRGEVRLKDDFTAEEFLMQRLREIGLK